MLDTVKLIRSFAEMPDIARLTARGGVPIFNQYTRQLESIRYTNERHKGDPRVTISQTPNGIWHYQVEASLPRFLRGANIPSLQPDELPHCLSLLCQYAESKTGMVFNAQTALVCRADFVRDEFLGKGKVTQALIKLSRLQIPKYLRKPINNESVIFAPKGERNSKSILVYDKWAEGLRRKADTKQLRLAEGILRIEVRLWTQALNYLIAQKHIASRQAQEILTPKVADLVLLDAKEKLQLNALALRETETIQLLLAKYGVTAETLIGFGEMFNRLGEDFYKDEANNYKRATYFRRLKMCRDAGVLP